MARDEPKEERAATASPKKKVSRKSSAATKAAKAASQQNWQGNVLSRIRNLILQADPDAVEERKWRKPSNPDGVPVWSHDGIICRGETYKTYVKLTFAKGAALKDPARLFNAGMDGNVRRAIDIGEHDKINEKAFKQLIRTAVQLNAAGDG